MTQGAGQEPVVRTATLRDFRVPPYAQTPVPPQAQAAPPSPVPPRVPEPNPPVPGASVPPAPGAPVPPRAAAPPRPPHPGNAVVGDEQPEGYTPTERDLPVIRRGDTVQVQTVPEPHPVAEGSRGPLFVVGDVHGYLDELFAALGEQGLIDADGNWAAGNARLWFLGDFTDRGPDGIGVIDLVMRLSAEAAAAAWLLQGPDGQPRAAADRRQAVRRHPRQLRGRRPPPSRPPGCSTAGRRPTWSASRTSTSSGCPGSTRSSRRTGIC